MLQEYDQTLTTNKEYTSTTEQYGELLSAYISGATSYYEPDALGSTDALLNDAGTMTDQYAYRAFGLSTRLLDNTANDFDWVGRKGYFDDPEISLYFLRERYYDFATGTFISEDPSGFRGGDSNLYRYVKNNPVNKIDPSGLDILVPVSDLYLQSYNLPLLPESYAQMLATQFYGAGGKSVPTSLTTWSFNADTSDSAWYLRNQIFTEYAPWPQNTWTNETDYAITSNFRPTVNGVQYGKFNIFNQLPPVLWDKVQGSTSNLSWALWYATSGDQLLKVNSSSQLTWSTVPTPGFLENLKSWVNALSTAAINVGSLAFQGVAYLLQVALEAFLKAAGIDPNQFQSALNTFASSATSSRPSRAAR